MKDERCAEEEVGTPTLTVELEREARMLPWSAFVSGIFDGGRIALNFTDWRIVIEGDRLKELWSSLQLQDVRVIRMSPLGSRQADEDDYLIRSLSMHSVLVE